MKAAELRIGNYVKGLGFNIFWIVEGIENDFIYSSKAWRLLSCFEPIPLTEEWLLEFGFEKEYINQTGCDFFRFGEHEIFYYPEKKEFKYDMLILSDGVNIKHIHQLQNLYFALAGEELTIIL
jgi:hypothetical protein